MSKVIMWLAFLFSLALYPFFLGQVIYGMQHLTEPLSYLECVRVGWSITIATVLLMLNTIEIVVYYGMNKGERNDNAS